MRYATRDPMVSIRDPVRNETMRDCTTCKRRPAPGTDYRQTACCRCRPWEPKDDKATIQTGPEIMDMIAAHKTVTLAMR